MNTVWGIMIASVLMTTGMAIGILVEKLLPNGRGAAAQSGAASKGDGKPENMKEWLRNKLKPWHSYQGD